MRQFGARLLCFLVATVACSSGYSYSLSGRITLGTYDSRELVLQNPDVSGNNSNDVATVSGRFFLRAYDITENKFELISDIRDKNDFFGIVDSQRQTLTQANTLQFRQFSVKYPGPHFFTELGRFPVPEAGTVFTDGMLQGAVLSHQFRLAAFGGLNPKRSDQTFVQWNSDSQVYGTYLTYIPLYQPWGTAFFLNTAAATDIVQSQTDRTYWYTNAVFQWNPMSRVSLLTYLDFVPNTYLQNGSFDYSQGLGSKWQTSLNYFSIDVIEYLRLKNIRSQLSPSPYHEGDAKVRYLPNNRVSIEGGYSLGHRFADNLDRKEASLGAYLSRLLGVHWDLNLLTGYRDNFTSYDTFGDIQLDYFSNVWEIDLSEDFGVENYKTDRAVYHLLVTELSLSRTFKNSLYGTFSVQDVHDERVQILTVFMKLSYRFGSKEIPPVRDGAPPKGRL